MGPRDPEDGEMHVGVGMANSRPAFCPACERFIGPAEACPYCDADSARNPTLRYLRYAALLLAGVGLILLYRTARQTDISRIRVGEITPMMNFATVRISGRVERDPLVRRRNGQMDYLSFRIDDGSGDVQVVAYRKLAQRLAEENRIPRSGMRVEARGQLRVDAAGQARLFPNSPEHIRVEPASESGATLPPPVRSRGEPRGTS